MPRAPGLLRRPLLGILAIWYALVAAEVGGAHACPMHDATAAPAGVEAAAAGMEAHAHHGAPAPADGPVHECTCPGESCDLATAGALPVARLSTHFAIAVADVRAVFGQATDFRPAPTPFLRPFANGPPARASA